MIRKATDADTPYLCAFAARFHRAASLPGEYNAGAWARFVETVHDQDGAFFLSERGMIGGLKMPQPWNDNYMTASEVCWWSEDKQGVALLNAFEDWAADCDEIHMMFLESLRPAAVMRYLQSRGYVKGQTMMVKKCPS